MKLADAPPPGWYPDPTGPQRLRWWDGTDWTDHRRIAPRVGMIAMAEEAAAAARAGAAGAGSGLGAAAGSGARATNGGSTGGGLTRNQTAQVVDEVRRATRSELDRATRSLTGQANDVREQLEPLVREYGTKVVRWARIAIVVAVVLFVAYLLLSAAVQAGVTSGLTEVFENLFDGSTESSGRGLVSAGAWSVAVRGPVPRF